MLYFQKNPTNVFQNQGKNDFYNGRRANITRIYIVDEEVWNILPSFLYCTTKVTIPSRLVK